MRRRDRLRRHDPVRTSPVRDFSNLYKYSGAPNRRSDPSNEPTSEQPLSNSSADASQAKGVELAYRVIDKHISEGRRSAERFGKRNYNMRAATDGLQPILDLILRYQSEMLPLWAGTLASLTRVDLSGVPYRPGPKSKPWSKGSSNNGSIALSIELLSTRPIEVSIKLEDHSEVGRLVSLGLRAVDPNKPGLIDVSFTPPAQTGTCGKLRIRIPETQPPDTYSGVIVDRDTGETRGTLSVRIAK